MDPSDVGSKRADQLPLTRHHADFVVHWGFGPQENAQLFRDGAQSPPADHWVED